MKNLIFANSAKHLLNGVKQAGILSPSEFNFIDILPNKDDKFIFPDGESYIRLNNMVLIKGNPATVVFSGQTKNNRTNDALAELEIMLYILKGRADSIELVFTYMPYAMQDNEFGDGEANVSKQMIEKYLNYFGVKKIIVFDAHCSNKDWFKKIERDGKLKNIINPITSLFKEKLKEDFGDEAEDIIFIAPDYGAQDRLHMEGFGKKRIDSYNVELKENSLDLKNFAGKNICVCDDLIESGGTLSRVAEKLKEAGAKKAIAFATHGVLASGLERIKEAYDKVYITNSINRECANMDICRILAEEIR
ncbi:MAG: hypothetical protein DRN66_02045 [Candidatus Nanohalarchaeota archaeon]|nr:MAG: hypothetical protein DRN66_02045 [Candidatus Nanohaloarchaeota archaeon]